MQKTHILLVILIGVIACNSPKQKLSPELQKTVDHYSHSEADTLKLKATWFLIENMGDHRSNDSKELRAYYTFLDSLFKNEKDFDRLDSIYKNYTIKSPNRRHNIFPDKEYIKADYLIKNIDDAFDSWREPWARHLSFDQFCEYLLPYRVHDEVLEPWRMLYKKKYSGYFDNSDYNKLSTIQACAKLNNELKKLNIKLNTNTPYTLGIRPSTLINMNFGNCQNFSNIGILAMRSIGIPVAIDQMIDHQWNVVITPTGPVSFAPAEGNPDGHLKFLKKWKKRFAKIHRQTFSINSQSLPFVCGKEEIPAQLNTPYLKDVSNEYFKGADINVKTINPKVKNKHILYLCDFKNHFRFLDWAKINQSKAEFKNMGDSIVYFPVYYFPSAIKQANYPILIKKNGTLHEILKPDFKKTQTMVLQLQPTPENNRGNLYVGDKYMLLYMGMSGWTNLGIKTAQSNSLLYNNVPKNAIYLLKNTSREERSNIFTYENNKQVWW
ncbi:hypothetical protein [Flavobacterium sp. Root420]|uniref:hypothetical protein n=1 Tax=Flavobacterium sp. Root420 TaxID=1736533 RepID=UPI0006FE76F5|nr:hypothetical protein [Flavobacterium sp. Root420]KQX10986.1 hypothetical protein ASC72_21185 [Flavobacterium sp. Root420]